MNIESISWEKILGALSLAATVIYYIFRVRGANGKKNSTPAPPANNIVINQHNHNGAAQPTEHPIDAPASKAKERSTLGIIFIDDDVKFKVVSILKNHGWANTRIMKDVTSLDQAEVLSADIFFVDIQGVGKALGFKDEGLGLVVALKKRFPTKKIVIYSAETGINAFHPAFKSADDQISKDADPYEFIDAVERLSA